MIVAFFGFIRPFGTIPIGIANSKWPQFQF